MKKENPIKRIFDLYTSDLSFDEIERLIKRDANEVYEYFAHEIKRPDERSGKFVRVLVFIKNLINAFLLKLTPARRLFYFIAVFIFFIGILGPNNMYLVLSFLIMNLLLAFELADKLISKSDLVSATKVQDSLIPKPPFENKNYDIAAFYQSAKEVGGDYYDYIELDCEDRHLLVIGDISGKGIAAALYMVRVQAIINLLSSQIKDVKEIVIKLKKYFSQKLKRDFFLTLSAASIEKDGTLKICRAGHAPVIHFKKESGEFEHIEQKGLGIGFNDHGVFEKSLEEVQVKSSSGDILVFYTDGLCELMNEAKLQFGLERVEKTILSNADKSVEEITNRLKENLNYFLANAIQNDDVSVVVLKRK
ncbi:MAG: SpoIIE family protein phosphatase [Melioribacteraceae bacterium]|nr:SpoIIE family protein phosphatase [Melioribacteraceae bacterium]MCF8263120.1 SpoIIE family protein phosphatase [Melioribacteraceae bacterium]MCF8413831.1 SpoIIE family protein phosphatase [Melioribacteraceae bacterium]MCF8430548.1 SpoIIE family protein phosphatase [Melioribacteraceae bacterium]